MKIVSNNQISFQKRTIVKVSKQAPYNKFIMILFIFLQQYKAKSTCCSLFTTTVLHMLYNTNYTYTVYSQIFDFIHNSTIHSFTLFVCNHLAVSLPVAAESIRCFNEVSMIIHFGSYKFQCISRISSVERRQLDRSVKIKKKKEEENGREWIKLSVKKTEEKKERR